MARIVVSILTCLIAIYWYTNIIHVQGTLSKANKEKKAKAKKVKTIDYLNQLAGICNKININRWAVIYLNFFHENS